MNYVQLEFLFAILLMVGVAGIIVSCNYSSSLVFLEGHPAIVAGGLMLLLQFNPHEIVISYEFLHLWVFSWTIFTKRFFFDFFLDVHPFYLFFHNVFNHVVNLNLNILIVGHLLGFYQVLKPLKYQVLLYVQGIALISELTPLNTKSFERCSSCVLFATNRRCC